MEANYIGANKGHCQVQWSFYLPRSLFENREKIGLNEQSSKKRIVFYIRKIGKGK